MVYMGCVTLRKGRFNIGRVTLRKKGFAWDMSHWGRAGLYGRCHIKEGMV